MDCLENMITMPKYDSDDDDGRRGRPRELKAYILESEGGFPPEISSDLMTARMRSTGLDDIKILQVSQNEGSLEFFLDTSDSRFFILHTNERSDDAGCVVKTLTKDRRHTFDNAWFYSDMLYGFTKRGGNAFNGFGVRYVNDTFLPDGADGSDNDSTGIDDLSIAVNGSLAHHVVDMFCDKPDIRKTMALDKVRIRRGQDSSDFVQDDVTHNGCFSIKRGRSVQDHLHLVDACREEYSRTIRHVEESSIGVRTVDERTLVEGTSFDFEFKDPIEDLDLFVDRMFDAAEPFRLWGLKSKIRDGHFKITAVDMHAGAPINFDISSNLMRAYLFRGNCGNTILRLLTNLQIHYDSQTTCRQIARDGE